MEEGRIQPQTVSHKVTFEPNLKGLCDFRFNGILDPVHARARRRRTDTELVKLTTAKTFPVGSIKIGCLIDRLFDGDLWLQLVIGLFLTAIQ